MDFFKKIFPLSFKYEGEKMIWAAILHYAAANVISFVPFVGLIGYLYAWAGLVVMMLNKLELVKFDAPAAEAEEKAE